MFIPICKVIDLGLIDYQEAWDLQNKLAHEIALGNQPSTLLLLEHPHTYTFGRSGHLENLKWDEAELTRRGVKVYWVDRGGDVTYHGPGQLVGYPLLSLGNITQASTDGPEGTRQLPRVNYISYLHELEETLIRAVELLGIHGHREQGMTGVWVGSPRPTKIAAIGVKVDAGGISRHGFALNVNPDMLYWQGIIGCGLEDFAVTSLAEILHPAPEMKAVKSAVVSAFGQVFKFDMRKY